MARKVVGTKASYLLASLGILVLLLFYTIEKCCAQAQALPTDKPSPRLTLEDFPWLDNDEGTTSEEDGRFLSRGRRSTNDTTGSKSIWQKIEEFYSDNNNMAMFCVLPIMVLIYGGCSAIYCVYKCRQYLRRRKHKRLKEEDSESLTSGKNDLNPESKGMGMSKDGPVSHISQGWTGFQVDPNEKRWLGHTEGKPLGSSSSPLPWQVPSKVAAAEALAQTRHDDNPNSSRAGYVKDRLREDDIPLQHPAHGRPQEGDRQHVQLPPPVKGVAPQVFEATRAHANLADYAINRSSATKATDYSRFSDSRPIEIVPLSADPNLRVWDPLHNRPFGEQSLSRDPKRATGARPGSVQEMKEELLARYDVMATFQMAKKAAQILSNNAVEKNPFQRKPNRKNKNIYTTD